MLSQPSLDRVANVLQSKVIVLDQCQANTKKCQTAPQVSAWETNLPASSQFSIWDSHRRSSSLWHCGAALWGPANTTCPHVRVLQGLTLPPQPENIARPGKAIGMEGADTQARGTVGEYTADFCLSPTRVAFSLAPQQCLVFAGTGKHLLLALLPVERGKSSHPKQKIMGICFQVYSSHSLSLQVKSPELAFFLCKASFLAKANWCLSLMLSAE